MIFCNERLLQRVMSKFCNDGRVILKRVTTNEWISTSNDQRVKIYTSFIANIKKLWAEKSIENNCEEVRFYKTTKSKDAFKNRFGAYIQID